MLRFMALPRCRPAAALIVAAALALQAFVAGLAAAEGARAVTPGAADFAVICHGGGVADQGNGTAPEPRTNVISRRAVRAGLSQAPPSQI